MITRPRKNAILDLHHLSVSEALGKVYLFLTTTQEKQVLIITGKGIHSSKGIPKIKPAVQKFLPRLGYTYKYAPRKLGGTGALIVSKRTFPSTALPQKIWY